MNRNVETQVPHPQEFVVFRIQGQEFCLDIELVREIRSATATTPLPHSPVEFKGLINLRGVILPVVDLAARLGLPISGPASNPVVIVAEAGSSLIGLEVDIVDDIISVDVATIQPTPEVASNGIQPFVRGIINIDGRMICIIVLDRLLPQETADVA
jgi:purine-binding chemotaxis protein CheW